MNFDFSEEERKYHLELESTLAGFIAEENLGEGDSGITGEIVEKCLHVLAGNGYLNLGLEKSDTALGGSLNLMACMEILASASQTLYLAVEIVERDPLYRAPLALPVELLPFRSDLLGRPLIVDLYKGVSRLRDPVGAEHDDRRRRRCRADPDVPLVQQRPHPA